MSPSDCARLGAIGLTTRATSRLLDGSSGCTVSMSSVSLNSPSPSDPMGTRAFSGGVPPSSVITERRPCPYAKSSAVLPLALTMDVSALCSRRTCTTRAGASSPASVTSHSHAQWSAVRPLASCRSTVPPFSSSRRASSAAPNSAAVCSGVHFFLANAKSTSAPLSISMLAISISFCSSQWCTCCRSESVQTKSSGDWPSLSSGIWTGSPSLRIFAPSSRTARRISGTPLRTA
mmetsp:Transcript_854/g.1603  ORF Transcript_854/g.1603 Transcript_854/m.1603 type:complete len:233 (-) Transcript_854:93-791(-)